MDGGSSSDGAFTTYWQESNSSAAHLEHISNALNATLDPRISNDVRQQALQHLEAVKNQPDAPQSGFTLADDWKQNDAVRYYGLQLLEFAVRYKWNDYTYDQTVQLRTWVKCLAGSLREQDATFIRNKIGQLWVEVAKRCWGGDDWSDMDTLLVNLWDKPMDQKGVVNNLLVLGILEALSEDIINNEDAVAGLRMDVLGHALNEIMIPEGLYVQHAQTRGNVQEVRYGSEGWLNRVCVFFAMCVKEARMDGHPELVRSMETCAIKALNALRPTVTWISLKAAEEVNCIDCLYLPFHTSNVALQTAAVEVLYALIGRQYNPHFNDVWKSLLRQALRPDRVAMIRQAFERTQAGPGEDEEKYTLQKKMSEVLSVLADSLSQHPKLADGTVDLPAFFDLLLLVTQHKSLTTSIPVLHSWTKLLSVQEERIVDLVLAALPTLLQISSERLVRYEALPEDLEDDIMQYLAEDFDTVPERHAFLGNYRRYCTTIIQSIARYRPIEAVSIVLQDMRSMLENGPYTGARGFDSTNYTKASVPVLKFDAQYNVVSGALKGYSAWMSDVRDVVPEQELYAKVQTDQQEAAEALQQWCYGMMSVHTDDPGVAEQVLQTFVLVLRTLKSPTSNFVLSMVQHILTMRLYDQPAHTSYSDSIKAFEALRVFELQKVALAFPNALLEVYNELEPRVNVLAQKHADDPRLLWGYKAFLFMILHRASGIDNDTRMSKLQEMLQPTYEAWAKPGLTGQVNSLQSFCDTVGMNNLPEFYRAEGFDRIQEWSAQELDEAGKALQWEIKEKADHLPLRMTKSMLSATTEKLRSATDEYDNASALWGGLIPVILPNLLQMIRHAVAFHNLANWSHLPDELQMVVRRTLQDRFWQSGISNESKEEFYARISGSKTSYEGFASTIRGTVRNVREQGYHLLYLMTKFDEQFYGLPQLAEPLADALFADAGSLSANHLHPIINLTTGLVQRCPPHYRTQFLPPILQQLFIKLDAKISAEWESIGAAADRSQQEMDELSDEMRTESVLRQLTYAMVSFVPFLLEYDRQAGVPHTNGNGAHSPAKTSLSDLVLSDASVLEPLMLFCTHALRMRDSRCCSTICKVFRGIVPMFATTTGTATISAETAHQVREFISDEVLKACITSLNEPYFADLQKDLAALISQIILLYSSKTTTPRSILLSLPDMPEVKVDKAIHRVCKTQNERQQRALVLELLEGVRGVSIYEQGKVNRGKAAGGAPKKKMATQMQYMEVEQRPQIAQGEEEGLESVAGLFGGE
ncbi:related to nuclear transport receptor CRM1 MSN5 (importin beta superfamily) [Lecanosticta acicola]|uniref:Related to nuclear transport receptor CRM1 MSN5 (Importin beta superfamily) n=1 Tax=Lecanosticta acicola TaxID=111012 RepID=A0AAI9EA00_9PEZI|nr:related to nuclear transport receptor CRM1 MSN5 (importin beta superfamily) [Lecanosticta acicola]